MRKLIAVLGAAAAMIVAPSVASASTAPGTITLGCLATASSSAAHGTKVVITEVNSGKVEVTASVAGHKTTHVVAGSVLGTATASFDLGSAARGKTVTVTVAGAQAGLLWSCATSVIGR